MTDDLVDVEPIDEYDNGFIYEKKKRRVEYLRKELFDVLKLYDDKLQERFDLVSKRDALLKEMGLIEMRVKDVVYSEKNPDSGKLVFSNAEMRELEVRQRLMKMDDYKKLSDRYAEIAYALDGVKKDLDVVEVRLKVCRALCGLESLGGDTEWF